MEVLRSSETSVHIRTTRSYIREDDSIYNYRCKNLKSYNKYIFFILFVFVRLTAQILSLQFLFAQSFASQYVCTQLLMVIHYEREHIVFA
jgi:hypothetical protein